MQSDGQLLGYLRVDARFDAVAGTLIWDAALGDLLGTLFLPAFIMPAYVQSFDPAVRI